MKGHINFLTTLMPSLGYYRDKDDREIFLAVDGGILYVRDGILTLTSREVFESEDSEKLREIIDNAILKRDKSETGFLKMLEGIERSFIEKTVEDAEVTKKEASELKEKHLEEMNTLKDLKMQMLEKMKEETEIERKKQLAEAKKEATEIIEKEKAIFYAEKRRYETELKDKAIDTVSIFASNLLKDISDEELHRCIYRKLLDELGQIASEIARIREKEKTLTIDLYLFTAYQLNEEELRKFQNAIESSISQEVALNTTVDNSLIAGMRIKAYDMVYDYSLSGPIDTLKLRLKETT